MLPLVQHYIDSLPDNLFLCCTPMVHISTILNVIRGVRPFYPGRSDRSGGENRQQLINAYDNSIRYTDYFLHHLIQILDSTNHTTALYYSPDHGEDLLDDDRKRFLHASPHPTYYQLHIPLFLWFSDQYRQEFPNDMQRHSPTRHNRYLQSWLFTRCWTWPLSRPHY